MQKEGMSKDLKSLGLQHNYSKEIPPRYSLMCVKAELKRLTLRILTCNVIGYIESNIAQMENRTLLKSHLVS